MNNSFKLGLLLVGFLCVGCDNAPPPSTEAETKQLYDSPDYEKQMLGGGEAPAK